MYKVFRENNNVHIEDWLGQTVYGCSDDFFVLYETEIGRTEVKRVRDLNDEQLLRAFIAARKFPL